jgi:predicted O-methyltransferase YrrM
MLKFPAIKPDVPMDMHGWFDDRNKEFLKTILTPHIKIIVELGSWLGTSTRWFCDNSSAHIISVDHWLGSIEHQGRKDVRDKLPTLYETFIVNCWDYKDRITPIRMNTIAGMYYISDADIQPDMVFIDASHEFKDVVADLETASELFPKAILVGDDWSWKNKKQDKRFTVREAVEHFSKQTGLKVIHNSRCWMIKK